MNINKAHEFKTYYVVFLHANMYEVAWDKLQLVTEKSILFKKHEKSS